MDKQISIIVPVYKIENYLNECIESIVNQTYTNLEIILVDDGSPDDCPTLCDQWAEKDKRIVVIHKKNGGLSSARNAGLDVAHGEYISFCDGDDVVHVRMYERIIRAMESNAADVALFSMHMFEDEAEVPDTAADIAQGTIRCVGREEVLEEVTTGIQYGGYVCNKMIRRKVLEKGYLLRFREDLLMMEDQLFTIGAVENAARYIYIDEMLYFYRQRTGSLLHQKFNRKSLCEITARTEVFRIMEKKYSSASFLPKVWNLMMKSYAITAKKVMLVDWEDKREILRDIIQEFKYFRGKYRLNTSWNLKEKCYYVMLSILCFFS